jgi:glycine cleavage system H protein
MSKPNPQDRKYSKDHEWVLENGDGTITMGITDHAQEMMTDIVYVELPPVGKKVKQFEPIAVVESVKSVSDVYAPVGGEVAETNKQLEQQPEIVNQDAFGKGWIAKMKMDNPDDLNLLMNAEAYDALIKAEQH